MYLKKHRAYRISYAGRCLRKRRLISEFDINLPRSASSASLLYQLHGIQFFALPMCTTLSFVYAASEIYVQTKQGWLSKWVQERRLFSAGPFIPKQPSSCEILDRIIPEGSRGSSCHASGCEVESNQKHAGLEQVRTQPCFVSSCPKHSQGLGLVVGLHL